MALVSLSEVKTALGIVTASAEQDVFLNRMIDLADQTAREYTGRHFSSAQFVEIWYAPAKVTTREYPIISVDAVVSDGTSITPGSLRLDARRGRLWRPDGDAMDWAGTDKLTVTYTAGYATIPAPIQEWCFLLIDIKWRAWASSRGLESGGNQVSAIKNPDGSGVNYATLAGIGGTPADLPNYMAGAPLSALDSYRDPSAASFRRICQGDPMTAWEMTARPLLYERKAAPRLSSRAHSRGPRMGN